VDCTAIEEEGKEGRGGKRNILQKTPNKKDYSLRIVLPRGVIGLDDRLISGNLVNR
jgi:hypothetical protein